MTRITRWAAIPAISAMLALAGAAGAQASTVYHAGSCTARGQYATCVASGNAYRPYVIYAHVYVNRGQYLRIYYDVVCWKGTGAGSKSGSFRIWVPRGHAVRHKVPHPYYHPAGCSIATDAQISRGNYLHLWNTYYRW